MRLPDELRQRRLTPNDLEATGILSFASFMKVDEKTLSPARLPSPAARLNLNEEVVTCES
jgi:hypothetical protein